MDLRVALGSLGEPSRPAQLVPRGPRRTYEGWTEGHRTFALDAHSKGNSGWREKDKVMTRILKKLPGN